MDYGISGRTALVTGGDSGIGWHTARMLLAEGVTVVLSDQDQASLDEAAAELHAPEGALHAFAADVTKLDSLAAMKAAIEGAGLEIDILVHCAGITGAQGFFHEIDDEGWTRTIEVDLFGAVRTVKTFLPHLRHGGWGRIVLISSEDGVQPYDDEIPYCSAKAGVLALMKGISRTYAKEGLLSNCVSPAFIHTPMTDAMMVKRSKEEDLSFDDAVETFLTDKRPYMAIKRRGEPEEVAAVNLFLCSEQASFVNGANYRVDAGAVASI